MIIKMELKKVELAIKDCYDEDYPFLFENMLDYMRELLREKGLEYDGQVKLYGDISNTQGRGLWIEGLHLDGNDIEKIIGREIDGSWNCSILTKAYRDTTTQLEDSCIWEGDNDADQTAFDWDSVIVEVEDFMKDIEHKVMKYGEADMEAVDEENLARGAWNRRKETNDVRTDLEVYDLNYETARRPMPEHLTMIADSGDTSLLGLWVDLTSYEIKAHTEQTIIKKDDKIDSDVIAVFYTLEKK